ncbi:MAG: Wzz/FepE/Etk N-terminal domain-containing protein [Chloroflexota bacterium]|jgi:capsular polysaccharide biosynthesis protein/GGDEF domain-containing protein
MVQLRMYLHALLRNWWIVVVTAVCAVALTLLINSMTQPVYESRVQLLIAPNMTGFEGRDLIYSMDTLDKRSIVATFVEVLNSGRIRREALDTTGLSAIGGEDYEISAVALPEASVLEVGVTGPNPETTAALADAVALRTISYVSQTYDIYRIELLDPAIAPVIPISPTPLRDASLALFLGLILGGVLAVLRDQIQQPVTGKLRQWNAHDRDSTAYKRTYLENQLERLLPLESEQLVLSVVRLEGLSRLELPAYALHNLLRRIIAIMRDELPGRDLIGRWDEHSFAVLMRQVPDLEQAGFRLHRLQQALSDPIEVYTGGEVINLSPRLAAVVGQQDDTVTSLIERLSTAMVQASKNGYEPTLYREDAQLTSATQ